MAVLLTRKHSKSLHGTGHKPKEITIIFIIFHFVILHLLNMVMLLAV